MWHSSAAMHAVAWVYLYIILRQGYQIKFVWLSLNQFVFQTLSLIKSHSVDMLSVYELLKGEALYQPHLS